MDARRGLWEVHYDPYDLGHVWVRDHHAGGWITAPWTHLGTVRQPFADFTWRRARELVAMRGADDRDETAVTMALENLLRRAEAGPGINADRSREDQRDRRIVGRNSAAAASPQHPSLVQMPDDLEQDENAVDLADDPSRITVVPFGVFDPLAESEHL